MDICENPISKGGGDGESDDGGELHPDSVDLGSGVLGYASYDQTKPPDPNENREKVFLTVWRLCSRVVEGRRFCLNPHASPSQRQSRLFTHPLFRFFGNSNAADPCTVQGSRAESP